MLSEEHLQGKYLYSGVHHQKFWNFYMLRFVKNEYFWPYSISGSPSTPLSIGIAWNMGARNKIETGSSRIFTHGRLVLASATWTSKNPFGRRWVPGVSKEANPVLYECPSHRNSKCRKSWPPFGDDFRGRSFFSSYSWRRDDLCHHFPNCFPTRAANCHFPRSRFAKCP